MPSKQETFDTVALHLLKQGKQARETFPDRTGFENSGACVYRAPDGCKCAAGVLIPDDRYSPDLEGGVVGTDMQGVKNSAVTNLIASLGHDVELVADLQTVHDSKTPPFWVEELLKVARLYTLETTVVDTFVPAPEGV